MKSLIRFQLLFNQIENTVRILNTIRVHDEVKTKGHNINNEKIYPR